MERMRNFYRTLTGKPQGKKPLGKSKHRWEDNIKMNLEMGYVADWTGSGSSPVAGSFEQGKEPSSA